MLSGSPCFHAVAYRIRVLSTVERTTAINPKNIRNIKLAYKLLGLALIAGHFVSHPLVVHPPALLLYLAIFLAVTVTHVFGVKPIIDEIKRARRHQSALQYVDREKIEIVGRFNKTFRSALKRPLRNLGLVIGEDGILLVPLLWAGVSPVTALVAAMAFGAMHYPAFTRLQCVSKGVAYYFACLLVLPYGLLNMLAGHLLLDAVMMLFAWRRLKRRLESG